MNVLLVILKKPVAIYSIIGAFLLLGILTIFNLPTRLFPDVDRPSLVVRVKYQGAPLLAIENSITMPLEEELGALNGLTKLRSKTTSNGVDLFLYFDWGMKVESLKLSTREKIDLLRYQLPPDCQITVDNNDTSTDPNIIIHAISSNKQLAHDLNRLIVNKAKPALEKIPTVAKVKLSGLSREKYILNLNPQKLQLFSVAPSDIIKQIQKENIQAHLGAIKDPKRNIPLTFKQPLNSINDLEKITIPTKRGEVPLVEIGKFAFAITHEKSISSYQTQNSIEIQIYKTSKANSLELSKQVKQKLKELNNKKPQDQAYQLNVIYDEANYITSAIKTITINGFLGAFLAILILWLFLGQFRLTIVIALCLPIIALIAICFFPLFKISINIFSLVGLALAMGMIIDGIIVVVESLDKIHQEENLSPRETVEKAIRAVAKPIVASVNTSIVVFLPIIFIHGVSGIVFRDLALTIILVMLSGLLVYFTFVPLRLLSTLINEDKLHKNTVETPFVSWLENRYYHALEYLLSHVKRSSIFILTAIVIMIICFYFRPQLDFFSSHPEKDYKISLLFPPQIPLEHIYTQANQIETLLKKDSAFTITSGHFEPENTYIQVHGETEIPLINARIKARLRHTNFSSFFVSPLSPINRLFGGSNRADYLLTIEDNSPERLNKATHNLIPKLKNSFGILQARPLTGATVPKLEFHPKVKAQNTLALSRSDLADNIQFYTNEQYITSINSENRPTPVFLQTDISHLPSYQQFLELPMVNAKLPSRLQLGDALTIKKTMQPISIFRQERKRIGEIALNTSRGSTLESLKESIGNIFTASYKSMNWNFSPPDLNIDETFTNLFAAALIAIILIYIVLAVQFESILYPFIIILSIPLTSVGIIGGLKSTGFHFDIPAFIGSTILFGIVVNNAIMLIDTANKLRKGQIERDQALTLGAKSRLRPILMTTFTTILAALPTALNSGTGSELYQSLSIVLISGLTISTLLTLFVIPIVYRLIDSFINWTDAIILKCELWFIH